MYFLAKYIWCDNQGNIWEFFNHKIDFTILTEFMLLYLKVFLFSCVFYFFYYTFNFFSLEFDQFEKFHYIFHFELLGFNFIHSFYMKILVCDWNFLSIFSIFKKKIRKDSKNFIQHFYRLCQILNIIWIYFLRVKVI